ncbi:MAG TPA: urea ABC transporter permease subunit UrtC, partial [Marinobacter sp.]|nr:urea ABC transporter permease subunit UrtC [Marinobacter sp.]
MWLTRPLQERSTRIFLGVLFASLVIVSVLHVFMPQDSALHVSAYTVTLLGKYLCYALLA